MVDCQNNKHKFQNLLTMYPVWIVVKYAESTAVKLWSIALNW